MDEDQDLGWNIRFRLVPFDLSDLSCDVLIAVWIVPA
jgi:hypothetical protein